MNFQYSIFGIIPLIGSFIVLILAIYGFRKRSSRLHLYFAILALAVFFWCLGFAMEFFSTSMWTNTFWNKVSYIGAAIAPPMWLILVLEYGKYEKYLKMKYLVLLMVLPFLIIILAFTNEWHGLLWPSILQISTQTGPFLIYKHGPVFWITVMYSSIMILTGTALLIRMYINSSKIYRLQISMLVFSGVIPMVSSFIYVSNTMKIPGLDITPFGLTVAVLLIAISIFKLRFLDIIPMAHVLLFKNMMNGVLVFDADDKLIEVNSAAKLIGISQHDLGKNADEVLGNFTEFKALYDGLISESELFIGDPQNIWIHVQITPIYNNKNVVQGRLLIIQDIDKRKKVEKELKRSLEEKELMVKEIHHRVKNNMQVISSLLSLQSMYHDDLNTRAVLLESQNRVQSMSMVHEKLYQSEDLSNIDMKEYIDQVILHLFASYNRDMAKIRTSVHVESVQMGINSAIPIGLIINELLTNSLKYAFPDGNGEISLKLSLDDNQYHLNVTDNGVGLPSDL